MKAAVYNRYWHSMGGGERHAGMIAQTLSEAGYEVDLVGHDEVDLDQLTTRLNLDLSRCRALVVPDRGDLEVARLSAGYDVWVTATYMSRLQPRAAQNYYLCFFPTPFDADLPPWRRQVARVLAPYLRRVDRTYTVGTGWHLPEPGRLRSSTWTSGDAVLALPAHGPQTIRMDVGRPGQPEPTTLEVVDGEGTVLATAAVAGKFARMEVAVPGYRHGTEVHLRSGTFTPGGGDTRELGVAVSRLQVGGRRGFRERVGYRFPWLLRDPANLTFLDAYTAVVANSEFTRGWVQRLWGVDAEVLYPPIRLPASPPTGPRERTVVAVGRFFRPGLGHAKRQLEMVQFFGAGVRSGALAGWTLHLVGGCEDSQKPYLEIVRAAARGLPVEIHANAPGALVDELMSTATVFWSATGYGDDEETRPWTSEHFGMTTVEAMGRGAVPVVIDRAGQKEIVREGVDGYRWSTPDEVVARTAEVGADESLRARLAASATARAQDYSEDAFRARWWAILGHRR